MDLIVQLLAYESGLESQLKILLSVLNVALPFFVSPDDFLVDDV